MQAGASATDPAPTTGRPRSRHLERLISSRGVLFVDLDGGQGPQRLPRGHGVATASSSGHQGVPVASAGPSPPDWERRVPGGGARDRRWAHLTASPSALDGARAKWDRRPDGRWMPSTSARSPTPVTPTRSSRPPTGPSTRSEPTAAAGPSTTLRGTSPGAAGWGPAATTCSRPPPRSASGPGPAGGPDAPPTLDEVVGQDHLLAPAPPAGADRGRPPDLGHPLGPPGTGKTTIAELIATHTARAFEQLSAVSAGVKDVRDVIAGAGAPRPARAGDDPVPRRGPPLQQGPTGRPAADGGDRPPRAHRRHHREPVLRGEPAAAVPRATLFRLEPLDEDASAGRCAAGARGRGRHGRRRGHRPPRRPGRRRRPPGLTRLEVAVAWPRPRRPGRRPYTLRPPSAPRRCATGATTTTTSSRRSSRASADPTRRRRALPRPDARGRGGRPVHRPPARHPGQRGRRHGRPDEPRGGRRRRPGRRVRRPARGPAQPGPGHHPPRRAPKSNRAAPPRCGPEADVASRLRPGGALHLRDGHPVQKRLEARLRYPTTTRGGSSRSTSPPTCRSHYLPSEHGSEAESPPPLEPPRTVDPSDVRQPWTLPNAAAVVIAAASAAAVRLRLSGRPAGATRRAPGRPPPSCATRPSRPWSPPDRAIDAADADLDRIDALLDAAEAVSGHHRGTRTWPTPGSTPVIKAVALAAQGSPRPRRLRQGSGGGPGRSDRRVQAAVLAGRRQAAGFTGSVWLQRRVKQAVDRVHARARPGRRRAAFEEGGVAMRDPEAELRGRYSPERRRRPTGRIWTVDTRAAPRLHRVLRGAGTRWCRRPA